MAPAAVTRAVRLTHEHLHRFATASGDLNPLHLDETFARATPHGRCIAHGALVALTALGTVDRATLLRVQALDVQFKQAIFPGDEYTISLVEQDSEKSRIEVARGGRLAASVALTTDAGSTPLADPSNEHSGDLLPSPRLYTLEELEGADVTLEERYVCRLDAMSALASDLGSAEVPHALLVWLAAASYTVGMLIPGRDALFVGARVRRSPAGDVGTLSASVTAVDDRTGLVIVDAALAQGDASAHMTLQTFLRPPVPPPDRSSIARVLAPSNALDGRTILVVGASRGIGAAVSGALATQGATVWAGFARSTSHAERLSSDFGRERIRPLQFDAEDVPDTQRAFDVVRRHANRLDAVVFCAAPPLHDSALHLEGAEAALRSVRSSVAMVLIPLTECLSVLSPGASLVVMSSSAVDDPPEPWPHYVAAKAALEGLADYCARHTSAGVVIIRAPKTWTDSTNTPLGRIGAAPKEQVAAAIVRLLTRRIRENSDGGGQPVLVTADELLEAAPAPDVPTA